MKRIPRMISSGALTPDSWNLVIAHRIEEMIREVSLLPGNGYLITKTSNGTCLSISQNPPGSPRTSDPWSVQTFTDTNNVLKWGVSAGSLLYQSLLPGDDIAIGGSAGIGLLADSPLPTDANWIAVNASTQTDVLYLEVEYDQNFSVTVASIDSFGNNGNFNNTNLAAWSSGSYAEAGTNVQYVRQVIAWAQSDSSGAVTVSQNLKSHLLLRNIVLDGIATRFPFPWDGGYSP